MNATEYYTAERLDQLIVEAASGSDSGAIAPDKSDLSRLHRLLRQRCVATVLEFGVGFSTLVIADALSKNAAEFGGDSPGHVAADAHRVISVDTSEKWIAETAARIPERLQRFVSSHHSAAHARTVNGQLCHYYDELPDIVPEFIYLDGPDPREVHGTVNGIGFANPERTPLAADLLMLEPSLLPGTMILVDGRINNVRFLDNNFRRPWKLSQDPEGNFAIFELTEPPLGARNKARLDVVTATKK